VKTQAHIEAIERAVTHTIMPVYGDEREISIVGTLHTFLPIKHRLYVECWGCGRENKSSIF
jgi:hypothetical protein